MLTLAVTAMALGFLHALIPNHWIPFVLLGHQRGWRTSRILFVTFLGGTAHLASTVLIGVAIGVLGLAMNVWFEKTMLRWISPGILMGVGVWVLLRGHRHLHGAGPQEHHHAHAPEYALAAAHDEGNHAPAEAHDHGGHGDERAPAEAHDHEAHAHEDAAAEHVHAVGTFSTRDFATLGALLAMMFFSPCVELEAYYLVAARHGWAGIWLVSAIYLVVTVSVLVVVVGVAAKGLEHVRWPFLERYEALLSGGLLILLGVIWMIFPL